MEKNDKRRDVEKLVAKTIRLGDLVDYQEGAVVSRAILGPNTQDGEDGGGQVKIENRPRTQWPPRSGNLGPWTPRNPGRSR